jgi:hypothetical protein
MKKILLTTGALAVMAIFISLAPSTVYAQATITACQNTSDGTLRIVSASTTCKKSETKISWPSVDDDTLGDLSCTAGQTVKFNGTSWVCESPNTLPRFELRTHTGGVQTVFDNQTGLEWEKKTGSVSTPVSCSTLPACPDPHDVNNTYQWSTNSTDPNGALFTDFLARLNTELSTSSDGRTVANVCFAGHCDWRIPNIAELRTILLAACPGGGSPCIDSIFGPTAASFYWSSTTTADNSNNAWTLRYGSARRRLLRVSELIRPLDTPLMWLLGESAFGCRVPE